MTTGHGEPCEFEQSLFCLNGGICYRIASVSGPFCKCIGKYTGTRCEGVFLAAEKQQPKSEYLVNILVFAVFLGLLFIGLICFLCRRKLNNRSEDVP
ncbi:pro-neuregulin-4, membrane-bound isoform [Pelobates fuscus]|uniref:pro-neuregulin-4, membrane-bound isoform n=1 Tax=Pelobates fuscus TaxID=191477 RepID=UPI002FE4331B